MTLEILPCHICQKQGEYVTENGVFCERHWHENVIARNHTVIDERFNREEQVEVPSE